MEDFSPTVRSVCQGCRRHRVAAAALTRGQVGLRSYYSGQAGLEGISHPVAVHHGRPYFLLRRLNGLLWLHRWRVGVLWDMSCPNAKHHSQHRGMKNVVLLCVGLRGADSDGRVLITSGVDNDRNGFVDNDRNGFLVSICARPQSARRTAASGGSCAKICR